MPFLIVAIGQKSVFDTSSLPELGEKNILPISPNTYLIKTNSSAEKYAEKAKEIIKAPYYVIDGGSFIWAGNPASEDIRKWIDDELNPPDGIPARWV